MPSRIELDQLAARYDLVVVGGGISGAGIFREAVRTGASVLLVEQGDFASGTSSTSSKLVHGGLRYLKNGQWRLTLESVRERQRLLREAPGLVEPLSFLMPIYRGMKPGRRLMQIGLALYDLMARGAQRSRWLGADALLAREGSLRREGLQGAMNYSDARTDDARLVLRQIFDATAQGGAARNYTQAALLRTGERVTGVQLTDRDSGESRALEAGMVINATGAWADGVPGAPAAPLKLRPLRGSHLVFPLSKLPLTEAVSWLHPRDARPIFAYPWEGAVLFGTTDLDHAASLGEPRISNDEVDYLMDGLRHQFPERALRASDAISSYSGVRPVVASGKANPSEESRESAMWASPGLVNVSGGKLTTFRVAAREALREAAKQSAKLAPAPEAAVFERGAADDHLRLRGRYGAPIADALLREADERIGETIYSWRELRWAARSEMVVHLSDLLLRRTRIGLVMEDGGAALLPQIEGICREELGWSAARWREEAELYRAHWERFHAPPAGIPANPGNQP